MYYKWIILGTCCLISFYISGTIMTGFTSVIEPLVNEFGWSYTQISFAASLRGFETGLIVPIAGLIMDRWGPRRMLFAGGMIGGFGLLLFSRVNSLSMFYTSFIFLAIGSGSASTSLLMAVVSRWFQKNSGLAMGIAASGVALGGLLLPLITFCIDTFGWRYAMLALGLGMWVFVLPLSLLLRSNPIPAAQPGEISHREDPKGMDRDEKTGDTLGSSHVRAVLGSRPFWIIAGTLLCQVLTVTAMTTHIMPFLSSIHFSRSKASMIASSIPILTIIGRVGFGWLADRFNNRNVTVLAFAATILAALLLNFTDTRHPWITVLFALSLGIGWGGAVPMISVLMIAYFGKTRLATLMGLIAGLMTVGMVIGAPLAGYIFDRSGSYTTAWYVVAVILTFATLLFIWLLPPINDRGRQAQAPVEAEPASV